MDNNHFQKNEETTQLLPRPAEDGGAYTVDTIQKTNEEPLNQPEMGAFLSEVFL